MIHSKLYIKAYSFRYRSLFHKAFAAVRQLRGAPAKSSSFFRWKHLWERWVESRCAAARQHRARRLLATCFSAWQQAGLRRSAAVFNRCKAEERRRCLLKYKSFAGLKQIMRQAYQCQVLSIRRYRRFLKKVLVHWKQLKLVQSRAAYSVFKGQTFRELRLCVSSFQRWREHLEDQCRIRKLGLFMKYWKRVMRKTFADTEVFAAGCRKRHLLTFRFRLLKKAVRNSIIQRKMQAQRRRCVFAAWRRATLGKKIRKVKSALAQEYCHNYHFQRKVRKYLGQSCALGVARRGAAQESSAKAVCKS